MAEGAIRHAIPPGSWTPRTRARRLCRPGPGRGHRAFQAPRAGRDLRSGPEVEAGGV